MGGQGMTRVAAVEEGAVGLVGGWLIRVIGGGGRGGGGRVGGGGGWERGVGGVRGG